MFAAGAFAALLLGRAHVHVTDGSLAGVLIGGALLAVAWPRPLALVIAFAASVITPIYLLASLATFDFDIDPEEVSHTSQSHLGLIAIACAMLGVAAVIVRIGTRRRLVVPEDAGELG